MAIFLAGFAWYYVFVGAMLCVNPNMGKRLADAWGGANIKRVVALLPLAFGALFFWAAPASRTPVLIQVLGSLAVLKGVYLLIAPRPQIKRFLDWWMRLKPSNYRLWGLLTIVIGVCIMTSI